MTSNWFTTYQESDWNPNKGYNEVFGESVRCVREWFKLEKVETGLEKGTNYWREYTLSKGIVYATVDQFIWNRFTKSKGQIYVYFLLKVRIASEPDGSGKILSNELRVLFPRGFPLKVPDVRSSSAQHHAIGGSHRHHIYPGGWLCLDDGNSWDPKTSTVMTAINWAIEWLYWHRVEFGF